MVSFANAAKLPMLLPARRAQANRSKLPRHCASASPELPADGSSSVFLRRERRAKLWSVMIPLSFRTMHCAHAAKNAC